MGHLDGLRVVDMKVALIFVISALLQQQHVVAGVRQRPRAGAVPRLEDVLDISLISLPSWGLNNTVTLSRDPTTYPTFNTLYLSLNNHGSQPLYRGKKLWSDPSPQITVSFQLGDGPQDLTCMYPKKSDPACPLGPGGGSYASAWNIVPGVQLDFTGGWQISPAGPMDPRPNFKIQPQNTNLELLGNCSQSSPCDGRNVTFFFSKIVAYTPVGVTPVNLTFEGFPFNETTFYKDTSFQVNIQKEPPS